MADGIDAGLRRRLADQGVHALADHELLALMLGPGCGPASLRASLGLLDSSGGMTGLARLEADELAAAPGVGPARAARVLAALELGRRLAAPEPVARQPIRDSVEVARWFRTRLWDQQREGIHALLLDGKHRLLRHLWLSQGSWNTCPLDPKLVFSVCLRRGASALILVHNHPSGDPSPSREDLDLTERLARAGQILGIRLVDHVIVGQDGYCSLADAGMI